MHDAGVTLERSHLTNWPLLWHHRMAPSRVDELVRCVDLTVRGYAEYRVLWEARAMSQEPLQLEKRAEPRSAEAGCRRQHNVLTTMNSS